MIENFRLSIQAVWGHKLRSLLTMLGIIIGIAAIISIFSIINGSTEKMKQEIIGGGNNSIDILFDSKSVFSKSIRKKSEKFPDYVPDFSEQEINQLSNAPHIRNSTLFHQQNMKIYKKELGISAETNAVSPKYFEITPQTLVDGRLFTQIDYSGMKQVCLLDQHVHEQLFEGESGINQYIEIQGTPFKIIGIVSEVGSDSQLPENKVYVPINNWFLLTDKINHEPTIRVQTYKTDDLQTVGNQVVNYLNEKIPDSDYSFGMNDYSEFAKNKEEIEKNNFLMLIGVASISLVVGGIGVMNIMLVSVTERTREIGLKKALGARKKTILFQFLTESVTLAIIGGIIGIIIGVFISITVTNIMGYPFILSKTSVIGSLLFSSSIGIIFGFLPAMKAANMNPIEALRFE